jgi:ribosome recycling factor
MSDPRLTALDPTCEIALVQVGSSHGRSCAFMHARHLHILVRRSGGTDIILFAPFASFADHLLFPSPQSPVPASRHSAYNRRLVHGFTLEPIMLNTIKTDAQTRMTKSVEALRLELTKLRTGRASTALVDHLKVNYYGSDVPLSQVASVAVSDSRSLTITPWEKPMVAAVEKAILASDLGLTPNTMGTVIRINLPALTEERRRELSKHVSHEGENAKVAIRNIRRDAMHQVKELLKEKDVTEDEAHRSDDEIQKLTDRFVKEVDEVVRAKEQELMAV